MTRVPKGSFCTLAADDDGKATDKWLALWASFSSTCSHVIGERSCCVTECPVSACVLLLCGPSRPSGRLILLLRGVGSLLLVFFVVRPLIGPLSPRRGGCSSDVLGDLPCTGTIPLRPPTDWDRPKAFCPGWALVPFAVPPLWAGPLHATQQFPLQSPPFRTPAVESSQH